jgi:SAM-dependent methyltransferase
MGVYDDEGGPVLTIANVEQAKAWDGGEGEHWATHADRYERAGWRHEERFNEAGVVRPRDRVLDIGCGTGRSTRNAGRTATDGSAHGVDLSAQMLEEAQRRARAEGLTNVSFEQADAQVHAFEPGAYDLAISSYGVMFFNDPVAAFVNIAGALAPGGRLGLMVWRELGRNDWVSSIRGALAVGRQLPEPPPEAPTPFSFADPARVQRILGAAGFDAIELTPLDEPLDFGTDADDAYAFMSNIGIVHGLTQDLDDAKKAEALAALRATIDAHDTGEGVLFDSSSWLVTARRA